MNYKQQSNKPYEHANQNLIFHTLDPEAQWSFPRAHLVYAAAGPKRIEFRFPMYQVAVELDKDNAEAQLTTVLQGATSVFEEVPKHKGDEKTSPEENPPVRVKRIFIESLQDEIY